MAKNSVFPQAAEIEWYEDRDGSQAVRVKFGDQPVARFTGYRNIADLMYQVSAYITRKALDFEETLSKEDRTRRRDWLSGKYRWE